uniref:t-SNARE coiled-coil homology domain-containing protein n=1 Tax=Acrobeloides nanus TaxID=290746 RepID=A0A914CGR1_9BILA
MNDIQSRNKAIIQVESNVRELHDLFIDMAIIVESQGEMLNNIETNISSAVEYTERAHENVKNAKSARDLNIKIKIAIGVSAAILLILLCLIVKFFFCFYFGCAK